MTLKVQTVETVGGPGSGSARRTAGWRRGLAAAGLALATSLSTVAVAPWAAAGPAGVADIVPAQYLISYQGNGGTGTPPPVQRIANGDSTRIASNTFIRGTYRFSGWNTRGDGRGTAYAPSALVTPTEDLTLYAQWAAQVYVEVLTSASSQVFRTSQPAQIGVGVSSDDDYPGGGGAVAPDRSGTVKIYDKGTLFRTVKAEPYGFTVLTLPATLPLGRHSFTAEFIPSGAGAKAVKSSNAQVFTVTKTSTTTRVVLRQQSLSAADQKKYKVRSAVSVSVQVVGRGTRTTAPGKVRINMGGRVTTLNLVGGKAKIPLTPTAAGRKTVVVDYQPSVSWWLASRSISAIDVRGFPVHVT